MPAANSAVPTGRALPARRGRPRGGGGVSSAAGRGCSPRLRRRGRTVRRCARWCLSGIGVVLTPRKVGIRGPPGLPSTGSIPVRRSADDAPPALSPARWTRGAARRPYPHRAPSSATSRRTPCPAFLRRVAVPWTGALVVLVVGVVEFLLDGRDASLPVTLAVLGLIAVAGALAPWFPVAAAVVVGLTFPVGSGFGLDGPNGAQLFALLLSTGWAGSQADV